MTKKYITTTTVNPEFTTNNNVFIPQFREVDHTLIPEFNWEKERDVLIKHMSEKLSRDVKTSTLYDKHIEITSTYTKVDLPYLNTLKRKIWFPSDLHDVGVTVDEIKNIKPTIIVADNPTEWIHFRRMISTMEYSKGVGRGIKFWIIDEVTDKVLGIVEVASDFGNLGERDRYIGWTRENRYQDNLLNNTCVGATIVPVQPFGFNFLGGKLMSLLATSNVVRKEWERRYGDKLVGITTTSLYGHRKGGSQYSGLNPVWKSLGHSTGQVKMKPNKSNYQRCVSWLKKFFREEYNHTQNQSSPKQKVLSLICRKLGIVQTSFNHRHQRGIYFSSFYHETLSFLQGEGVEVFTPRFDGKVESLVEKWRTKAIKRYLSVVEKNNIKSDVLFYTDIIEKSWVKVLEIHLSVRCVIKNTIVIVWGNNNQVKLNNTLHFSCLNQRTIQIGIISYLYFISFIRATSNYRSLTSCLLVP